MFDNPTSLAAAIFPAAIGSAAIGTSVWFCVSIGAVLVDGMPDATNPVEAFFMLAAAGLGFGFATVAATFVTAFWIALVGLPMAFLMGEKIGRPLALPIALSTGTAAALFLSFATSSPLDFHRIKDGFDWSWAILILSYALPAALLYHRFAKATRIDPSPD